MTLAILGALIYKRADFASFVVGRLIKEILTNEISPSLALVFIQYRVILVPSVYGLIFWFNATGQIRSVSFTLDVG